MSLTSTSSCLLIIFGSKTKLLVHYSQLDWSCTTVYIVANFDLEYLCKVVLGKMCIKCVLAYFRNETHLPTIVNVHSSDQAIGMHPSSASP